MDLIEQMGGYNVVKVAALNYRNSGDALTAKKFESACLEYRRANNIYEVGDKVVTLPDHNPYPFVLTISEVGADGWFFESGGKYCNGAICRHATDEEIKTGRRL